MGAGKLEGPHLLALEVEQGALSAKHLIGTVNSDIADQQDIACVRVVFRIVAKDAVFSVVDLDIVLRNSHALIEARITIRRDLHGRVAEAAKLGANGGKRSQQTKTEKELPH